MTPSSSSSFRRTALLSLGLCASLLLGVSVNAEQADRNKPLNAEADSLRYDDANQTSVFTGNVVITKGTIVIRGDQVQVRQDAQGNQVGVVLGNAAKRGFFRQKREAVDEWIEGEALRIDYDSKAETVVFTGNAVLRRYKGTQLNDESTGSVIHYNNATDVFNVRGGEASRTAANPTGRVRAMLTPAPKGEPGAPADPVTLRPSPLPAEKPAEGRK